MTSGNDEVNRGRVTSVNEPVHGTIPTDVVPDTDRSTLLQTLQNHFIVIACSGYKFQILAKQLPAP